MRSGTMFATAAAFAAIVGGLGAWIAAGARESERIVATGRRSWATVLGKEMDARRKNHSVEVRIEGVPDLAPLRRILRAGDWNGIREGDRLGYVYDPEWPAHGVLDPEIGMRTDVAGWFILGSFFVWPFLLAGLILKLRERKAARPA